MTENEHSHPETAPESVAEFEHATWSRCAGSYVDGFGALVCEAIPALLDCVGVTSGQRVLDVGTGPGLVAGAARQRGAEVSGVDFSEAMLDEARRRLPDVRFEHAGAESLPFEADSFDVVVANFVLHHCAAPVRVLREAQRVLRPGGRLGFTVWADLPKLAAFGLFLAAVEEHAEAAELPHGPFFGVSDFAVFHRAVRDAGFADSWIEELPIAWRTESLDGYLDSFRDWANLAAFPSEVREQIEASVRANAEPFRSGQYFVMPNPAILVTARK